MYFLHDIGCQEVEKLIGSGEIRTKELPNIFGHWVNGWGLQDWEFIRQKSV